MSTLITGGVIVPGHPVGAVYMDGAIAFDSQGVITGIGERRDFDSRHYDEVIDGRRLIVVPGLINAHSHCLSNLQKGRLEKLPLEIWRQYLKACWRSVSERHVYLAAMLGAIQMVKNGCTTVFDHFYTACPAEYMGAAQVMQAWSDLGVRGVLAPMLLDKPFDQTVPLNAATASAAGQAEIARISSSESRQTVADARRMLEQYHGANERISFFIGPAAPQRCTPQLLEDALRLAEDFDIGLHMHVAETRTQYYYALKNFGRTPVQQLDHLGFLTDRLSMAHCIWVTDEDIALIAERGASVVHNPTSNLKLGDGIAPVIKMVEAGVNVALATDGAGSNDGLNMFEAMKFGAILHCVTQDDYDRWISAAQSLTMATLNSAKACRLDAICGSLEVGKRADMVLLKRDHYSFVPLNNVVNQLVYCENGSAVQSVFVNGQRVVDDGALTMVDEAAIYQEIEEAVAAVASDFTRAFSDVAPLEPALRAMYFDVMRAMNTEQEFSFAPSE